MIRHTLTIGGLMKAERQGKNFYLRLDLAELLTLYCLLNEEKISPTHQGVALIKITNIE